MITSRIDWAGQIGPIGQVYILGWDKKNVSKSPTSFSIKGDDGKPVYIRSDRLRVAKTEMVIPLSECLEIALKQYRLGYIDKAEYIRLSQKIKSASA